MPPRKHALADADSNAQSGPSKGNKRGKKTPEAEDASASTSADGGNESTHKHKHGDLENRPPYEYYCMQRPIFDFENENEEKEEDDQLDEDEMGEKYNEYVDSKDSICLDPAADHPGYQWVCMWQAWKKLGDLRRCALYTCPDAFGMYIYNDFNGYGLQELVQNTLIDFDKEFSKKTRDDARLNEMWSIASSMVHWLLQEELGPWYMMSDGDLFNSTIDMIGLMFLTMLNELDQADLLKADSRIKDLGLVMAWNLPFSEMFDEAGESDLEWPRKIVAYAKKAGIELENAGLYGIKEKLDSIEDGKEIRPLSGQVKADRWTWKKKFNAFKRNHRITAGEKYNILKMSRKERASYAFDNKDPLKDISDKDLREGNIMPA